MSAWAASVLCLSSRLLQNVLQSVDTHLIAVGRPEFVHTHVLKRWKWNKSEKGKARLQRADMHTCLPLPLQRQHQADRPLVGQALYPPSLACRCVLRSCA